MISSFVRSSDRVTLVEQADFDPFAAWDEDDPGVELFLEAELEIDQFAAGRRCCRRCSRQSLRCAPESYRGFHLG